MSLYEFSYNLQYILNTNEAIKIIKCRSILNFTKRKKLKDIWSTGKLLIYEL